MTSCIDASPAEVVTGISQVLQSARPSADTLSAVQRQLVGFGAAAAAETVIESYYGCIVTEHLRRTFELATDALPVCVNTSHRAVRRVCVERGQHCHSTISDAAWAAGWQALRQLKGVDMYVQTVHRDRSLRHADLYVIAAGQIISLEYKYVDPKGLRNPKGCAAQMAPYLEAHAATRLVLYSGTPDQTPCGMDRLRALLPPDVPLELHGPAIAAVGSSGNVGEE